jgi:hypothetical protein
MFHIWLIFSKCRLSLLAFLLFSLALLDAGLRSRQLLLSLSDSELCCLLDLSELDLLRRFLRLVRRRVLSLLLELSSLLYDGVRRRLRRRLSSPPPRGRRSALCRLPRPLCTRNMRIYFFMTVNKKLMILVSVRILLTVIVRKQF